MPVTPKERLARVLAGSRVPGAFSAQLSVPARDVRLTVAGAGPISFPVQAPQANIRAERGHEPVPRRPAGPRAA